MNPIVMPITIYKGTVFEDYVYIPDESTGNGQDFTGYEFQAQLKDRPGGTLLATFTVTADVAPPGVDDTQGWVQITLDDSVSIAAGYYKGTWSLLAGAAATNPTLIAGGPVDIIGTATVWA